MSWKIHTLFIAAWLKTGEVSSMEGIPNGNYSVELHDRCNWVTAPVFYFNCHQFDYFLACMDQMCLDVCVLQHLGEFRRISEDASCLNNVVSRLFKGPACPIAGAPNMAWLQPCTFATFLGTCLQTCRSSCSEIANSEHWT